MKSLFTTERPKTNEERLADWNLRKRKKSQPAHDDAKVLRVALAAIALLVITVMVIGIMSHLSSNVTPAYPILR